MDNPLETSNSANPTIEGASVMEGDDFFQHEPLLASSEPQIRLIRLEGTSRPQLKFSMVHVELAKAPEYIALSYTWRNGKSTQEVFIDGKIFLVSPTVEEMLRAVARFHASSGRSLVLWLDQLCIDQNSMHDKNFQVGLMSGIYTQARYVVAWLSSCPEINTGAGTLSELALEVNHLRAIEIDDPLQDPFTTHRISPQKRALLMAFLETEYWRRTWIVQELTLARKVYILTSGHTLPWHHVSDCFSYLCRGPYLFFLSIFRLFKWLVAHLEKGSRSNCSLSELIYTFYGSHCSDPRDKIYGLRALIPETMQAMIPVDYSMSIVDVFVMASEAIIAEATDKCGLLHVIPSALEHLRAEMLPGEVDLWFTLGKALRHLWACDLDAMISQETRSQFLEEFRQLAGKQDPNSSLEAVAGLKS